MLTQPNYKHKHDNICTLLSTKRQNITVTKTKTLKSGHIDGEAGYIHQPALFIAGADDAVIARFKGEAHAGCEQLGSTPKTGVSQHGATG